MGLGDRLIKLAKKVPIDLGQENVNTVTKGKEIAFAMVPETPASERGKRTAVDVGCRSGQQTRQLEARGYHVTSIAIEKLFDQCIVVDADAFGAVLVFVLDGGRRKQHAVGQQSVRCQHLGGGAAVAVREEHGV